MKIIKRIATLIVVSLCASGVNAGAIMDWEGTNVDFYSSWISSNTLRIEIDAGSPQGGWANAVAIDSIAINDGGAWNWTSTSDILLSGPGTFGGPVDGSGLNANGCGSLSVGSNHPCWSGYASLVDDMFFDFTFFQAVSSQTDTPHLKVRFVNDQGKKVGSLLSTDLTTTTVSEPGVLALFGMGLIGLFCARRKTA